MYIALPACASRAGREPNCRRGSTEKGTGFVNRLMLVRIQSSALGVDCLDGVVDRMELAEGSGPGSIPGRDT